MPDGNPLAALYPQPQQASQQGGILGQNPLYALGMMSQINANRRFNQEFGAQQAIGQIYQQNVNPDGTVDLPNVMRMAAANPAAAWDMPEAYSTVQGQTSGQIGINQQQLALRNAQVATGMTYFAPLAQNKDATSDDVNNAATNAVKAGAPPDVVNAIRRQIITDPGGVAHGAGTVANTVMGPAAAATRVPGPLTGAGAQTSTSIGTANTVGTYPTELPPGASTALAANRGAFVQAQQNGGAIQANLRPLTTALSIAGSTPTAAFGPGASTWTSLMTGLQNVGVIPQGVSSANVKYDELNKYFSQYVSQFPSAQRSDMAQSLAQVGSPNTATAKAATIALTQKVIEFQRMDSVIAQGYKLDNPNGDTSDFLGYKNNYYSKYDPRAFGFDTMTPQQRQSIVESLGKPGSPAYEKFNHSLVLATQSGLFQAPGQ